MSFSFQLGHVEAVFTDKSDFKVFRDSQIPDTNKILFTAVGVSAGIADELDAVPLLRGLSDSVQRGDLVLYTTINGKRYYLGPLNTRNDPSNTVDPYYNPLKNNSQFVGDLSKDNADGTNLLSPEQKNPRLSKPNDLIMDFPSLSNQVDVSTIMYSESNFSDLVLEGRYGNAIRIGSRNQNPRLIISNNNNDSVETLGNGGSIFAMTSIGTIDNNFPTETHKEERNGELLDIPGYRLSADLDNKTIGFGNDIPENIFNLNYGFIKDYSSEESVIPNNEFDQIIISSDRIIFNSTVEDITISANRNINIGSNKNFTLNNKGFSVFQSPNIYIGEAAKRREQPMVLGDQLQKLFVKILRLLGDAQALGDMNIPQKLTLAPSIHVAGTLSQEVDRIIEEFNLEGSSEFEKNLDENGVAISDTITGQASFLSNRHFIEPNRIDSEE